MIQKKIQNLRKTFKKLNIDAYIIPKNDDFFSEYSKNDRLNVINKFNFLSAENTDAQILLKLFVELGNKAFENFGENFFFFKYDYNNKEAFIVRDHIGFNPIYYFQSESGLYLSSNIKFILELSSKKFDIDEKMVKSFLNLDPFSNFRLSIFEFFLKIHLSIWSHLLYCLSHSSTF